MTAQWKVAFLNYCQTLYRVENLQNRDGVMADKGFRIKKEIEAVGRTEYSTL